MAASRASQKRVKPPVISVTRYDVVSAFMIAIVIALIITVLWLCAVWVAHRIPKAEIPAELEILELPGGDLDGAIDETLRLDSPEDASDDPSLEDNETESEIEETIENVLELADQSTTQAHQQYTEELRHTGKKGSATGTGRRALGDGPGKSGFPREQRWFVRFSDQGTLAEYAAQLDFFGIELGALLPDGKLVYLSQLSNDKPNMREATTGKGEQRLYMTWQGGGRKSADVKLFQKQNIAVGSATIFHFYPPQTEQLLAQLELKYQNRAVEEIRRTYFVVQSEGNGFRFVVTKQRYFN